MNYFTAEVLKKIRHYVYLYIDPSTDEIFYVGKGVGNRAFAHLDDKSESEKTKRIIAIRSNGDEPRIELLAHDLDEENALRIEAVAIDLLDKRKLTNAVKGWGSGINGRMKVGQVQGLYSATEVEIKHPCLLIRINKLFRYGMSDIELYDATRGIWELGKKKPDLARAKFAFAVFEGIVQEVYEILEWFPGGSTLSTRGEGTNNPDRWEFVGRIAPYEIRKRYLYKSVREHFPKGAANPVCYGMKEVIGKKKN